MWYGLVVDPLAKVIRDGEEGHLRLGNFIEMGACVVGLLMLQIFSGAARPGRTATATAATMKAAWWG
jgi:hypothetical protein